MESTLSKINVCLHGWMCGFCNSTNKPKTYKTLKNTIRKRGTIISPTSPPSQIILTMKWKNYNSFLRFYLLCLDEIVAAADLILLAELDDFTEEKPKTYFKDDKKGWILFLSYQGGERNNEKLKVRIESMRM